MTWSSREVLGAWSGLVGMTENGDGLNGGPQAGGLLRGARQSLQEVCRHNIYLAHEPLRRSPDENLYQTVIRTV